MQRVLDPAQIEAFAERAIQRVRLAQPGSLFSERAQRLRTLSRSEQAAPGHPIGDYLRLMAVVADAQQSALASLSVAAPSADDVERARRHGMPLLHAGSHQRDSAWRAVLEQLCAGVLASTDLAGALPPATRELCARLRAAPVDVLENQADAILALRTEEVDAVAAPFITSALQVCWLALARQFSAAEIPQLPVPGVCPLCGTLPVASIVRVDRGSQGYRYLHCALCATEWHMVRVTCSQCQATKDLSYYLIEGGSDAVRAEACPECRSYRKILYQEKDIRVEPIADDLASVALDLLMSEQGYQRASGNPLLWVTP